MDIFHSCALAAFVDALPMDSGHMERSKNLAYKYYEDEIKKGDDMQEDHFFKSEEHGAHWGWIYVGAPRPKHEPEVQAAMRKQVEKLQFPDVSSMIDIKA